MIVKVTQEHIDKAFKEMREAQRMGEDKWCTMHCPVSLALKDTFKVNVVSTGYSNADIGQFPDNLIFTAKLPEDVGNWIEKFDNGYFTKNLITVEPFEFELSLEGVKL